MSHRSARESLLSTGLITLVVSVGGTTLNFVANVALARGLGPTEKGSYDLMIATAQLLTLLLGLSLPAGITYVVARRLAAPARLVAFAALIGLAQGLVVIALLEALPTFARDALVPASIGVAAAIPIGVYVAATSIGSYWRAILIGSERIIQMNVRDLVGRGAGTIAIVGVIVWLAMTARPDATSMIWTAAVAAVIAAAVFFIRPHLRGGAGLMAVMPTLFGFAVPAFAGNVVQYLNYRLDLFLVANLRTLRDVGLYAVAVAVAQIIWLISTAASTVLLPRVAAHHGDRGGMGQLTARAARLTLVACALAAIVMAFVGRIFLRVVYGAEYEPASDALLLLLPGIVALGYGRVLAAFIAGVGRPGLNFVVAAIALAITVAADLLLIPALGIAGAAIASSVSYIATAVLTVVPFVYLSHVGLGDLVMVKPEDARLVARWASSVASALRTRDDAG